MSKYKSLFVVFLMAGLVTLLTACDLSSDNYKIGVLMYNYTDVQGQEVQAYGDYLEANFDVEFEYVVVGTDDDKHVQAVENLLAIGVDAIISGYETVLKNSVQLASDAGVYYAVLLAEATQDLETVTDNPYFLGGIKQFGEDPADLGAAYADAAYEAGLTNIGFTSFQPFLFLDAPEIINGFIERLAVLNADAVVYDPYYHMFDPSEISNGVVNYISENPSMDGIFALGSGMDFIYPSLVSSGQIDNIKLLTLGFNNSSAQAVADGSLVMGGTNSITASMAYTFALIYDQLTGNTYESDINGLVDYPTFTDVETVNLFKTYITAADKANGAVTAEELKAVMKSFNEDATYSDLIALTTRTLEEIVAARTNE